MTEERNHGLKIFLRYWLFFALLAGVNVYMYVTRGRKLNLLIAVACAAVFIGWVLFYMFYVRRSRS